MRLNWLIGAVFTLVFIACNDDLSSVGMGIQPEEDKISVYNDTISFTSSTERVESIFIKTITGCLGSFDDPTYGSVKYGYICNFYTWPDSVFRHDVIDDRIDSVILRLYYSSYVGDSLTPMEATVYKVKKTLEKNFYSNIKLEDEYVDKNFILGRKTYTARDMNISDSLNSLSKSKVIDIKLWNVSLGEDFYKEWKREGGKETFKNLDEFFKFFPGLCVNSTYGSGNVLNVDWTQLLVYYNSHSVYTDVNGNDSIVVEPYAAHFYSSEEVTQLNMFESKDGDQILTNDTVTYLKTPVGVVTQLNIPLNTIVERVGKDKIFNNVKLTLKVEEQPNVKGWDYTMPMPQEVVLMSPDSVKTFFENSRYADGKYSYYTTLSTSSGYKYDFGNISTLIQNSIKNAIDAGQEPESLKLWVIPVETSATNSAILSGMTKNYFRPSGARIKAGKQNLKLYITTTKTKK